MKKDKGNENTTWNTFPSSDIKTMIEFSIINKTTAKIKRWKMWICKYLNITPAEFYSITLLIKYSGILNCAVGDLIMFEDSSLWRIMGTKGDDVIECMNVRTDISFYVLGNKFMVFSRAFKERSL